MENLTVQIRVRVTPQMRRILQERAARDRRKLSDTIRLLIEQALESKDDTAQKEGA